MEKWKDIVGYVGSYQISSLGRVRSLKRRVKCSKRGNLRINYERIMKPILINTGYFTICLNNGEVPRYPLISRLVAIHFIPNPEKKRTVNHKNGIKTNNRVENLEWMTDSENIKHSYRELGRKPTNTGRFGKDHRGSKSVLQLTRSGHLVAEHAGMAEAQRKTGVFRSSISRVCSGMRNHAGGFAWKFK
ncbi:hypothetical protein LCGC14_0503750 [marine sediment metagenome]|uniref:HNH nuclease domain-containing protein n=1 Tax=marine sediment metagenome TaxID=412755 RepID=A0A0F9SLK5_9ZZZZ